MQHTTYLNLNKPEIAVDRANIDVLNANMDILDTAVHNLETSEGSKQDKLTAGANIQINASNVISATDTTYSDFTGTDGTAAGTAGLVPAPAVTDTNKALFSDGTWKSVSTSAPVTDVEVDDISVVDPSGVAKIDLTGKQDTLTAGTNITIDANNVISATGNTDYTELTQAEYDELTPAEKENGTLYFITDADGDPQVVPNPQGTPTDTLNTIGINNTIYDIAGSGGGGGNGNGKVDLVYRAVDTSFVDIAFDISKYDLYIINASDSLLQSGETYTVTREALKYYLDNSIAFCGWPYRGSSANALIQYLVTANGFEADDHALGFVITSIYGINTGTVLAPMIYSEDEREVGCWIDNKPLYQKTFDLTSQALTDNAWNNNILGTTGISIKAYRGYFTLGTGAFFPYEYYRNNSEFFTVVTDIDTSDINVRPNMNAGTPVYAGIVTIWYTKDSDVAGSGSYGSLGIQMEHYDNTEKVVGTYFGDTLYAKSYDVDNPSNNATIISEDFSDKVITEITATGIRSSDGAVIPLQFVTTSNWIRVYAGTIYGGVYFESNIAISNIKITIKYTKSST